jgi:hypothetical protein
VVRKRPLVSTIRTDGNAGDSNTALDLLGTIEDDIASFTTDSAYDTIAPDGVDMPRSQLD